MIKNIFFVIFFTIMILKPEVFNWAKDEVTKAKISKYMRIFGCIGLVCVAVIIIMNLMGMA